MILEADEGRLVQSETVAELEKPVVTFYKNGAISSVLHAPKGQVQMQTKETEAWGGVTVVTSDSATLTTERLRYDPKRDRLLSDEDVRIERPDGVTQGHGLEATPDLNSVTIGHQTGRLKRQSDKAPVH